MNRVGTGFILVALVAILAIPAFGALNSNAEQPDRSTDIRGLLNSLKSGSEAQQENAAYLLGELKAEEAVIPLMRMLHQNETESGRIVAALALCRIGNPRGVFAVKRVVEFDSSSKVQERCAWFYNEYVRPGSFAFISTPVNQEPTFGAR